MPAKEPLELTWVELFVPPGLPPGPGGPAGPAPLEKIWIDWTSPDPHARVTSPVAFFEVSQITSCPVVAAEETGPLKHSPIAFVPWRCVAAGIVCVQVPPVQVPEAETT